MRVRSGGTYLPRRPSVFTQGISPVPAQDTEAQRPAPVQRAGSQRARRAAIGPIGSGASLSAGPVRLDEGSRPAGLQIPPAPHNQLDSTVGRAASEIRLPSARAPGLSSVCASAGDIDMLDVAALCVPSPWTTGPAAVGYVADAWRSRCGDCGVRTDNIYPPSYMSVLQYFVARNMSNVAGHDMLRG
ncbi:hypothetical protein ACCO45_009281 [Purpureocillium lilacinum]|uniref:Uncharacterized protein n=1 Tax=Purpureocillium lilacinum TaxID=33203 RepID=A0ACC4DM87_PURLI